MLHTLGKGYIMGFQQDASRKRRTADNARKLWYARFRMARFAKRMNPYLTTKDFRSFLFTVQPGG